MRTCLLGLAVLLIASSAARGEEPVPYLIEIKYVDYDPNGRVKVLSQPAVMTLEGQQAEVRVGQEVMSPTGTEKLVVGRMLRVTPLRKDGKLFLDAEMVLSDIRKQSDDCLQTTFTGFHAIQAVESGKKFTITPSATETQAGGPRCEIRVTRVDSMTDPKSPSPFAPRKDVLSRSERRP